MVDVLGEKAIVNCAHNGGKRSGGIYRVSEIGITDLSVMTMNTGKLFLFLS